MWSALGKYKSIVVSIALFLILDASVLTLNFYISFKIADDAVGVNLAGRQRMLSQRMVKSLYEVQTAEYGSDKQKKALQELLLTHSLFDQTLQAFDTGGEAQGADGSTVFLKPVTSEAGRAAISNAKELWAPYSLAVQAVVASNDQSALEKSLIEASSFATASNLTLLKLMNKLTVDLENVATSQATTLRYIQTGGITLAIINFLIILFHFIGELRVNDRQLEAARKETTDILDTVNEGLFLLDKDLNIGQQHSSKLPEMFGGKDICNLSFSDLIREYVKPKDLETAERFVALLFRPNVKDNLIKDLNPLNEVELNIPDENGGYNTRYLNFDFTRVTGSSADNSTVLVTVNDVTRSVMLAEQLANEREKNEQQMEMLTGILHADPATLKRFLQNAFDSFKNINTILKDQTKSESAMQRKLNDIFVEVHNFKGDASAMELDTFADHAHRFETDIQPLQKKSKLSGNDFLALTVHLENLIRYSESVQEIANKLASFSEISEGQERTSNAKPMKDRWAHLAKLTESVSQRESKNAYLVTTGFNEAELDEVSEKFVNDIAIQFIRNAVVHSIEPSDKRKLHGKESSGRIDARLVRLPTGELELSVRDDGMGINYEKIRSRALEMGRWNAEKIKAWSHKQLLPLIFEPGFSTAEELGSDAGRGVGMGVIKKRINDMGGKLKISSRTGVDCQFTVVVPARDQQVIAA